ncbi:MAG TPA: RNA polymerase sigma factor [Gammaproteobacteria bacterium]|nr:RNA polymerase sigma factor [Gammaproteobacteria bacterium]
MPPADGPSQSAWRFRLAMLQHHRTVFQVCYSLLGDAHEAEDVTQEAFLRYWQLSSEVRGAKAWLITVARNKCFDRLRAGKRLVDVEPEFFEQQAEERDPEWHANQAETSSRLRALIDELPEPQKSLIVLFDIQGMTGAECAEILGLNINQVKVYLHRARRRLRLALEECRD